MEDKTIPLSEVFGPTLQGEGPLAGVPTYFVRVGGCDYACAWCDTAKAVVPSRVRELPRKTAGEIFEQLRVLSNRHPGPSWVTISGGNPGLYDLTRLVDGWHDLRLPDGAPEWYGQVAVETQGSRWQKWFSNVDRLVISPKPPSSEMHKSFGVLQDFMAEVGRMRVSNLAIKVVVFDEKDYNFAAQVHKAYDEFPFYLSVGTAMGGLSGTWQPPTFQLGQTTIDGPVHDLTETHAARWRWLADRLKGDPSMRDVALFPQMHSLIWGFQTQGV